MADFGTEADLSFSDSSLASASRQLERELSGVNVDLRTSGPTTSRTGNRSGGGGVASTATTAVGTSLSGVSRTLDELAELGTERNTTLSELLETTERGGGGGEDGDGGSGIIGGILSAAGLRGVLGSVGVGTLISSAATVSASSLISSGATISASSLIASAATITPAALIASAAIISAGVLIADKPEISAAALIGSTAVIGAGALIGSTAVIGAGALIATAATISAADVVAEKIRASDLVESPGDDPVSEYTGGNPDRDMPDIWEDSPSRPSPNNIDAYFNPSNVPDANEIAAGNTDTDTDVDVPGPGDYEDINQRLDLSWINDEGESDLDNASGNASASDSGSNSARDRASQRTEIQNSPTYNVDTGGLERKIDQNFREFKRRLDRVEQDITRSGP